MEWKSQLNDYIIMVSIYSSFISPPERFADSVLCPRYRQVLMVLRMYVLPLGCVLIVYRMHVPMNAVLITVCYLNQHLMLPSTAIIDTLAIYVYR